MPVRLSIIILSYGPADIVHPCLESLSESVPALTAKVPSGNSETEVILVNNAHPKFDRQSLADQFPGTIFIEAEKNDGFAAGNNLGLRHASGDYLLLLNPDTIVPKETLTIMVDYMNQHPNVGAATCRVNLGNGQLDKACHRGFPTPWASLCYFLKLDRLFPRSKLFGRYHITWQSLDAIHEIDSPSGCFFLTRRTVLEQTGLLDEEFFLYGEDIDLAYRVKQTGWKIIYHPGATILHLKGISSGIKDATACQSVSSISDRTRAHHAFYEAMRIFYRKHMQQKYPWLVTKMVCLAVDLKEKLSRRKLRV